MTDFAQSRRKMVDNQLRTNDVTDHRVLDAMEAVPREKFVPASRRAVAYIDDDIQIGPVDSGRYLMKPHIFGKLVQLAGLQQNDVVLVIGAGSGYGPAVVSQLAASVVAVEENPALVALGSEILVELGIENAAVVEGELCKGFPSEGPYDAVLIDGAVEQLPEDLFAQLKDGGKLVVIEGQGGAGTAKLYQKSGGVVGGRFAFNASAALLPGFSKEIEFTF